MTIVSVFALLCVVGFFNWIVTLQTDAALLWIDDNQPKIQAMLNGLGYDLYVGPTWTNITPVQFTFCIAPKGLDSKTSELRYLPPRQIYALLARLNGPKPISVEEAAKFCATVGRSSLSILRWHLQ